ncbi:MAG: hypothetical protein OSB57_05795 [Planctomycetota bacterium]|jgi:hypothetical protein|nr:hypothetical protein [Planctomycetota bacterium]
MQVIQQLKQMSEDRFLHIYDTLSKDGFGPLDGEVAAALKFRPHTIKRLPMAKRAGRARLILQSDSNAELAYELFGAYLMNSCKPIITAFLDATDVKHEEGMIDDPATDRPDPTKVAAAVASLDEAHPPEDVTLYLSMCAEQWPDIEEVNAVWKMRS